MRRIHCATVIFLGALLSTAPGCSRPAPLTRVEGTVTLNGQPLPRVRVQFLPGSEPGRTGGMLSVGATDADGRYKLVCVDGRPGAVPGWYHVVISDLRVSTYKIPRKQRLDEDAQAASRKEAVKNRQSRVPEKYQRPNETPFVLEVKEGDANEIPLELTP